MTEEDHALRDMYKMEVGEDSEPLLTDAFIDYTITKNTVDTYINHRAIMYELFMRKHMNLMLLNIDGITVQRDMNVYLHQAIPYMARTTGCIKPEEMYPSDDFEGRNFFRQFNTGEEAY